MNLCKNITDVGFDGTYSLAVGHTLGHAIVIAFAKYFHLPLGCTRGLKCNKGHGHDVCCCRGHEGPLTSSLVPPHCVAIAWHIC